MRLWGSSTEANSTMSADRRDAEETLAVLFGGKTPSKKQDRDDIVSKLFERSAAPTDGEGIVLATPPTKRISSASPIAPQTEAGPSNSNTGLSFWRRLVGGGANTDREIVPRSDGSGSGELKEWRELPTCPIGGYTLTERGLVDLNPNNDPRQQHIATGHSIPVGVAVHRVLSASEVNTLLTEMISLEAKSRYELDATVLTTQDRKVSAGAATVSAPCLCATGLYLLFGLAPKVFSNTTPRGSVLFGDLAARFSRIGRMSEEQREQFAKNNRWWLRLTNKYLMSVLVGGVVCTTAGYCFSTPLDAPRNNVDVDTSRDTAVYAYHMTKSTKWLWCVYFHHPAYRDLAATRKLKVHT